MFIHMVLILKRNIEADRTGLWHQHLTEVCNVLSYMVSTGHTKYVACIPHYFHVGRHLPPDVVTAFNNGHFTVHVTREKFNGVWTDMAIEQT